MHNCVNYELFKSTTQEHLKCKHIKSLNMVNMVKFHIKRNFAKKGVVTKCREVDTPKFMVTVKRNIKPFEQ